MDHSPFTALLWSYKSERVEDKSGRKIWRHDKSISTQQTLLLRSTVYTHTRTYIPVYSASLVCCSNGNSGARSTIPAGSTMGKNKEHNRLHPRGFPVRDRTSVSYQLWIQQQRAGQVQFAVACCRGGWVTRRDTGEMEERGGRSDQLRRTRWQERVWLLAESRFSH